MSVESKVSSYVNPTLFKRSPCRVGEIVMNSIGTNFYQSSKLSNDGNYLLCSTDKNLIDIHRSDSSFLQQHYFYNTEQIINNVCENSSCEQELLPLVTSLDVGDTLYDFQSHPTMFDNGSLPLIVTATRDHPINLYSPTDHRVVGSYVPINQLDELDFTLSVAFNATGDKIYAGADRRIRAFDIAIAGRACTEFWTSESKKAFFGQKGLISCIKFNPDYSGVYAAGSYAGDVSVYAENTGAQSFLDIVRLGYGVTAMKWSPCGRYLWVAGRNSSEITCWDVRGTKRQVGSIQRSWATNQRTCFDIDPWGEYIMTGDDHGHILCYDTKTFSLVQDIDTGSDSTINACHFHPYSAIVFATQGERSFPLYKTGEASTGSDDNDSDSESDSDNKIESSHEPTTENPSIQKNKEEDLLAVLLGKRKVLEALQKHTAPDSGSTAQKKARRGEKLPSSQLGNRPRTFQDRGTKMSRILTYAFQRSLQIATIDSSVSEMAAETVETAIEPQATSLANAEGAGAARDVDTVSVGQKRPYTAIETTEMFNCI